MKKFIFFFILLIIITLQSSGQKTKDVLYLKNGSIVYGSLVEITNEHYRLKSSDGSIFNFSPGEVEKYAREKPAITSRQKSGMTYSLETGFLLGSQSSQYPAPFSFNALAGYTLAKKNTFSIGSGVEFLDKTFIPLYFEYKYTFRDSRVSPFLFTRGGFIMHPGKDEKPSNGSYIKKDYQGGPSLTIGTGLSWAKEDVETYLSFAYRYAETSYVQVEYNNSEVTYLNYYNRLEIKFGFRF